jgi:hypothetical protein
MLHVAIVQDENGFTALATLCSLNKFVHLADNG